MKSKFPTKNQKEKENKKLQRPWYLYLHILGKNAGKQTAYMMVIYLALYYFLHEPEPENTNFFKDFIHDVNPVILIKGWLLDFSKYVLMWIGATKTISNTGEDYKKTLEISKDLTRPLTRENLKKSSWRVIAKHQGKNNPRLAKKMIKQMAQGEPINIDVFQKTIRAFLESDPDGLKFLQEYFDEIPQELIELHTRVFEKDK